MVIGSDYSLLHPKLVVSPSKAHDFLFTVMRDSNTSSVDFVRYAQRSMRLLVEDAIAEFPIKLVKSMTTPCGTFTGTQRCLSLLSEDQSSSISLPLSRSSWDVTKLCAVSIVRSGDALLEVVREVEPSCKVGKILIQRNEETVEKSPTLFYQKLPRDIGNMYVLLCDPMLATGGSAVKALDVLCKDYKVDPNKVVFANLICCPEGLKAIADSYPDVTIVTVKIDDCLNDDKYIVPGLGDFGDVGIRSFGLFSLTKVLACGTMLYSVFVFVCHFTRVYNVPRRDTSTRCRKEPIYATNETLFCWD